jgi:uncharacterized protein (TIGR03067 family)
MIIAQGKRSAALGYGGKMISSFFLLVWRASDAPNQKEKRGSEDWPFPEAATLTALPWAILMPPLWIFIHRSVAGRCGRCGSCCGANTAQKRDGQYISFAADPPNQTSKEDLAQLQGEWSMISGMVDGYAIPTEMLPNSRRICKGDQLTATVGGQLVMKAKITLDPSRKPKTIDYQVTDGPTKGRKHLGIYEVDGDTMKSCFGAPGAERPTDFTSKAGGQAHLDRMEASQGLRPS